MRFALLSAASVALLSSTMALATTAPLTPGNLVVAVSGVGATGITTTIPSGAATALSLYQYTPTGKTGATFAGSSVVTGSTNAFSSEYGSSSEGFLQRSGDGKSLVIMGYGIDAATYNAATTCPTPSTCTNSYVPVTPTSAGKLAALAQTSSLSSAASPVARVIANITADGNVDTSTALLNVFDQNNPRSVWTQDGSTFYVSGQGAKNDATSGVFYTTRGATGATAITGLDSTGKTVSQDTRDVQVVNGQLYVSADSKGGSNAARSFIGTLSTANPPSTTPTTLANDGNGPTMLLGYADGKGKLKMTGNLGNGLNAGLTINLSPEQFFFASDSVLYVTDSGAPKNDNAAVTDAGNSVDLGDGGLQKWVKTGNTWSLAYTLSAGLGLVANYDYTTHTAVTTGTSGLFGLAGMLNGDGTVSLYATSYTLGDTDTSYLFSISDTLTATSNSSRFTTIDSLTGSKFMGLAFAPDAVPEPASWAMMVIGFGLIGGVVRRRRVVFA